MEHIKPQGRGRWNKVRGCGWGERVDVWRRAWREDVVVEVVEGRGRRWLRQIRIRWLRGMIYGEGG